MDRRIPLRVESPRARPNGYVIYRGPSLIDGAPVVVIVTGLREASSNNKTGAMLQTYVLRADRAPLAALKDGSDHSICGDCVHRVVDGAGSCYVNVAQGPEAVYGAYVRGAYPDASPEEAAELCAGLLIRLGSYGDPAAVPAGVWETLICRAAGWTGYTHQWRRARVQVYRRFLMASADSEAQQRRAVAAGWRTFRVKQKDDPRLPGEIVCPASEEAGRKRTCETCGACDGAKDSPRRVSVVIDVHGLVWKAQRYALAQKALRQRKRFRLAAGR
jgi:hypothetical protein